MTKYLYTQFKQSGGIDKTLFVPSLRKTKVQEIKNKHQQNIERISEMFLKICTFLLVCGVVLCNNAICDSTKCKSIPKHYEELGCYAVKKAGECCATR